MDYLTGVREDGSTDDGCGMRLESLAGALYLDHLQGENERRAARNRPARAALAVREVARDVQLPGVPLSFIS